MRHGGCVYEFGKDKVIDYSSNINPIRYNADLKSIKDAYIYPDIEYRELKDAVSEYLGCNRDNVVVGNGAVEIIDAFVSAFKRVVVFIPCFSEYVDRARIRGCNVVRFKLDDNFNIDLNRIYDLEKDDLLILGNPNNPTGYRIEEEVLKKIYKICRERDAYLLLDEAFYEFSCDYDSIQLFKDKQGVAVIRAATKFFSLPGIRLGYAYVSSEIKQRIEELLLPWNVNVFANAFALKFLRDKEYIRLSKEFIEEERRYMILELEKIEGIVVYKTQANFILIRLLKHNEETIFKRMLQKGILIRKCSSFEGLDNRYIRIAIKDRENNKKFLQAFREALYD
ncbi:pyridoxal phosphate-dependent aminotransferase [Caloramator proteoclasticus]|uniref:Threonine-phosphate decarboxylase n=1 Tax=Caloramator proteoclasticus DSM 10124 TaxID=1121262 RepID=A0A1M4S8I6_9CLOT|nr:threonine-phosphate decarboxylase [Caloramator proteoclasticus]SHE28519.1 threonine-phosphate decarboxylase [Caloramator proteoclasticus DSM 10124]